MKTSIVFALGVIVTISAFFCMGFTSSGVSDPKGIILVANDGGGAYYYKEGRLFFIKDKVAHKIEF